MKPVNDLKMTDDQLMDLLPMQFVAQMRHPRDCYPSVSTNTLDNLPIGYLFEVFDLFGEVQDVPYASTADHCAYHAYKTLTNTEISIKELQVMTGEKGNWTEDAIITMAELDKVNIAVARSRSGVQIVINDHTTDVVHLLVHSNLMGNEGEELQEETIEDLAIMGEMPQGHWHACTYVQTRPVNAYLTCKTVNVTDVQRKLIARELNIDIDAVGTFTLE